MNICKYVKKSFGQIDKGQVCGSVEMSWNAPFFFSTHADSYDRLQACVLYFIYMSLATFKTMWNTAVSNKNCNELFSQKFRTEANSYHIP